MIEVRDSMNRSRSVGSRSSARYFAFSSVKQIAGVRSTSSPSRISLTFLPAADPWKYSTQAQESKAFMNFPLVAQALRAQPWVGAEEGSFRAKQGLGQDVIDGLRQAAGTDLAEEMRLDIFP